MYQYYIFVILISLSFSSVSIIEQKDGLWLLYYDSVHEDSPDQKLDNYVQNVANFQVSVC